ncbi:MAG: hypothetical protein HKN25_00425 [Pyrinomonadaceae bacterium]|nr:hypothetical protein [Pyrinomonadaceae bacterium]
MIFKVFHKGKNVLFAWIVFLVFGLFLFQFSVYPKLKAAGENRELPEESFGYSTDYFYGFVDKISEAGRAMYFNFQLLDLVNALLLGITLFATLTYFLNRITDKKLARVILVLPVLAALFDILENASIIYLLSDFPDRIGALTQTASLFTKLKLTAGSLSGLFVLICGVIVLVKFMVDKWRR